MIFDDLVEPFEGSGDFVFASLFWEFGDHRKVQYSSVREQNKIYLLRCQ